MFFMQSTLFITLLPKHQTFRFSNHSLFNLTQLQTFILVVVLSIFLNIAPLIKNYITRFLNPKGWQIVQEIVIKNPSSWRVRSFSI